MTQLAEVIPIKRPPTWDDVRNEYGKMEQMGFQSVQQAARVGEMLIEIKAETEHGEFDANVTRALHLKSNSAARMTASRLMTLARHLPLLEQHTPDSQRAALALIKAHKPFRVTWIKLIAERLGLSYTAVRRLNTADEIRIKLGVTFRQVFTDEASADAFVEKYVRTIVCHRTNPLVRS